MTPGVLVAVGTVFVTPGVLVAVGTVFFVVAIVFFVIWQRNKTRG
jgi:hypothetical protein